MQHSRWAQPDGQSANPGENFNRQSLFGAPLSNFAQGQSNYSNNMGVCTYYQRGTCRFGDKCKNEHPGSQRDGGSGFSAGSNTNRFGAFGSGDRYRPGQSSGSNTFGGNRDPKALPFHLDKADIQNDLTGQRPVYPLSCYGPGRDAPRQLIEGPVEISPEEMRLRYYTLRAAGNEPTAQQEESALGDKMQQQLKAILDDIDGAIRYVEEGANVHPNRIDIAKGTTSSTAPANTPSAVSGSSANPFMKPPANAFSTGASTQSSAFGQASTPGFGRPAFGQPANPAQTTSTFGQASSPAQTTSAFGQASNPGQSASPFGAASNPGQSASPFGAASSLGQKPSPFGQPSALGGAGAFGKPAFGASGFGQPSMPGSGSAFGQPSSIGQGSAFGQPSAPGTTPGFGQANALGQKPSPFSKPGFGQSGFGQPSQPGATASPFGQQAQSGPSPFGQQAQTKQSPFGQQAQQGTQASPFGQQNPPAQQASPFAQGQAQQPAAQPSPFGGAASSQPSVFGQPSKPSPFGTQPAQSTTAQTPNPFQKPQASTPSTAAAPSGFGVQSQAAPTSGQTQAQPQQPTPSFAQQAQPAAASAGGNIDPKDRFKEGKPEEYEGEQGRILEEIYRRVGQLGRFNDDEDIPLTPPKCEWIVPIALL